MADLILDLVSRDDWPDVELGAVWEAVLSEYVGRESWARLSGEASDSACSQYEGSWGAGICRVITYR